MKTERWVIVLSIVCGLLVWLIDAMLDYFIFYEEVRGTFLEMLLTEPPAHEVYIRLLILTAFTGFGVVVSWVISRRRRAVDALRASEERFRLLFERSPISYQSLDAEGRFVEVNPAWLETLGYDRSEVVGRWFGDFLAPEYQDSFRERFPRFKEAGEVHGVQFEMIHKSGDRLIVEFDGRVGQDEKGHFKQTHCVLRDITKQKQAQEALWESKRFLQTVIDAVPDVMLVIDRDHRIVLANRAAKVSCGNEDPVAAGMTCYQLAHGCDEPCKEPANPCPLEQVVATGEPVSVVQLHRDARGDEIFMEINAAPIFDGGGEVVQMIESCRDVTERVRAEETLRESLQSSADIVRSIPSGLFIYQYEAPDRLTLLEANPEAQRLTGVRIEESRGRQFDEIWPEAHDRGTTEAFLGAVRTGGTYQNEELFYHDERLEGAFNVRAFKMPGNRLGVAFEDVTERRKAELALQESEERFRSLVETSSDWIWEVNRDAVYTYVSPKIKDLLGYEPEEVLGRTPFDLMPPEEAARVGEFFREAAGTHTVPRSRSRPLVAVENTNLHKDGHSVVLETSAVPMLDEDGNLLGYRGVDRDVTERKRAADELARTQALLLASSEQTPAGLLIADAPDVRIRIANSAALGIRGATEEPLTDIPADLHPRNWQTFHPDGTPFAPEDLPLSRAILKGETSKNVDVIIRRPNGERRWILANAAPVRNAKGEIIAGVVVFPDVTELKQAERQREELIEKLENQNAELERFTYTVSHDLKSPLITIKGYLGLLEEDMAGGRDEAVEDDMGRMARAADKMEELLDELLELSRVGRMVNPSEHVPLGEIAREAVELVAGQIAERGVAVEISSELPVIFGDRPRLREVLQNLVENAVKYMGDQSQPRIEIGARLGQQEPTCYVRDNGVGIEPRYQEKIFGLFDQLDAQAEGTGIGLALVKRIVEVHGGRVWVESEGVGSGTTFCFVIPPQGKTESPGE